MKHFIPIAAATVAAAVTPGVLVADAAGRPGVEWGYTR